MIQSWFWNLVDRLAETASGKKMGELEQIESLLQGAIAGVEPRNIFKKELGERLVHQVDEASVEVEGLGRKKGVTPKTFDLPLLVTGVISGLVLIVMGVGLLIRIQERSRSIQE